MISRIKKEAYINVASLITHFTKTKISREKKMLATFHEQDEFYTFKPKLTVQI